MAWKNVFIRNEKKYFILLISLLSSLLIVGGYLYYDESTKNIRSNKENELATIAEMKISQISHWYLDELNDAEIISEDRILTELIESSLPNTNQETTESLYNLLLSLKRQHNDEDIIVTDLNSNIIASTNSIYNFNNLSSKLQKSIQKTIKEELTHSTDLYLCEIRKNISIDFLAPVKNKNDKIIAVIIFQFDPEKFLFPLIQNWPTKSKTSETHLIRKEGDKVLFLNELRYKKGTALKLNLSLSDKDKSSVVAVSGKKGIYEGYDYRGVRVISYLSDIPGTNWFIVSKVDKEEILSELKYYWLYTSLFVLLLIFLVASLFTWIYFYRQRDIYKKLWENQEEYKTTLHSIGDAVITTDLKGKIKYLNPVAEKLTGWNLSEAKNKNLREVFSIINEDKKNEVENPVDKVLREGTIVGLANHTLLISKNGNEIPIADSGAPIKDQSGNIIGVVLVFRDQSEERKTQKEIYRLNRVYALLSNTNQAIIRIKEEKKLFDEICRIAITDGKFLVAWIGMKEEYSGTFNVVASAYFQNSNTDEVKNNLINIKLLTLLSDKVLDEKKHQVVNDLQNSVNVELFNNIEIFNTFKSAASFPIMKSNLVVGTLNLFSDEVGFSDEEEIRLLVEMAFDISFAIEYFEKERERNHSIEKLKENEAFLRESEEKYRLLVENSHDGIEITQDDRIIYSNKQFAQMLGYSVKEIMNVSFKEIYTEQAIKDLFERENKRKSGEELINEYETTFKKKNSEIIYVAVKIEIIEFNNKPATFATIQDITERKKATEILKQSEEKFRDLFYHHAAIKMIVDPENQNIVDANEAAAKYYGWSVDQLKKMKISQINTLSPDEVNNAIDKAKSLQKVHFEFKHCKADGSINDVEVFSSKVVIDGKEYLHSIVHDISEKKKAEEQLKLLSRSVEQSPVSVIITDPSGNIEYVNPCFTKVTGYTLDEIKGKNPKILKSGHHSKKQYENLWDTILAGKEWRGELMNKKKNGELFWEDIIISSMINNDGDILHFVAVKEDITDKKRMIEELIEAKEKAEEMSRLKSIFLANMSHELRTPLIGITGFAYILQEEIKDPGLKEMAKGINESGNRLSETLNLILDLSKLEAEKVNIKIEKHDLVFETEDLIASYRESAKKKGLKLNSFYSNELLEFNTDLRAYRSILSNIVNNAIKYTESGEVNVDISLINDYAVIKISDTGIGIAKEHHDLIFEEFRQVSEGFSRNFEGTGLGLNITKKLIEKIGGKIKVESELGKGSTFIVTIPQGKTEMNTLEEKEVRIDRPFTAPDVKPEKPIALLVDDDPIAFDILKRFTSDLLRLEYCEEANKSIKMLNEKKYDLIFMDINLRKGMDGKQAATAIKKIKGYENIPIVAFTAYAMVGDKEEFLDAGCTHYLSKPFTKNSVIELVSEIVKK